VIKCGTADLWTYELTNGYTANQNLRTASADQWVNCGPVKCGPHMIERLIRDVP